jgi:hypothetical protein
MVLDHTARRDLDGPVQALDRDLIGVTWLRRWRLLLTRLRSAGKGNVGPSWLRRKRL